MRMRVRAVPETCEGRRENVKLQTPRMKGQIYLIMFPVKCIEWDESTSIDRCRWNEEGGGQGVLSAGNER